MLRAHSAGTVCHLQSPRFLDRAFRVLSQLGRYEKYLDAVVHLDCPLHLYRRAPGPPGPDDEPTRPPVNSKGEATLQEFREEFRKMVSNILRRPPLALSTGQVPVTVWSGRAYAPALAHSDRLSAYVFIRYLAWSPTGT